MESRWAGDHLLIKRYQLRSTFTSCESKYEGRWGRWGYLKLGWYGNGGFFESDAWSWDWYIGFAV